MNVALRLKERFLGMPSHAPVEDRTSQLQKDTAALEVGLSDRYTTFVEHDGDKLAVVIERATGKVLSVLVLGPPEMALGYGT